MAQPHTPACRNISHTHTYLAMLVQMAVTHTLCVQMALTHTHEHGGASLPRAREQTLIVQMAKTHTLCVQMAMTHTHLRA